jgi:hypothetical protein
VRGGAGAPPITSSGVSGTPGPSPMPSGDTGLSEAGQVSGWSGRPSARATPLAPGGPTQAAEPAAGGGLRLAQPQNRNLPTAGSFAQAQQPGAELVPPQLRHMSPPQAAAWLFNRAQQHAAIGDTEGAKLLAQQGMSIQNAIKETTSPTTEMKNAAAAGQTLGQYQAEQEAMKKYGEAKGKRVGEVVEAGGMPARQTIRTLTTMDEAFAAGGDRIFTGPKAEQWLKVKQAANNLFPGIFQGVPESETIVKLNAQLASEAAKAMTARPSQLEFRAFMANNPGLSTSIQGSRILISILRQAKQQDIALGASR